MDDAEPLSFEQTLTALLDLMGAQVEVTLFAREPRGLVATFEGTFDRGRDIQHPTREMEGEALIFSLSGAARFVLEERLFDYACYVEDAPGTVRIYLDGGPLIQVDPAESPENS
jgi:hypothetical protein